ncbi:type VI secretion system baseplate subunit TssK [Parashewanella curva]|uniref:Type VI secretion system baseplate subunit TssK n=1 Tax=Parashewanella curva TaxID=2338552 RepID=A0A3L8Q2N7_9GAMM|nr:type VI secretion system baseplate subunit TssK [Parashewanella curva]RLV61248.1 type VI secretion system baseplate subunit TssK [Parashewanella curva]
METKKIVWTEGMFLSPQHFQQQERYLENYTREYATLVTPNCFGLYDLAIKFSLLSIGKIHVEHAKGIFPDGTPFSLMNGITLEVPENSAKKKVYLALPIARSGVVEVGEDERMRHRLAEHQVFDTSQESSEALNIEIGIPNVTLKLEGEDLKDYTLLAIAQILEFKYEGEVVLNEAFVPFCLHFGVSTYLRESISDLYAQMQYRAKTIAQRLTADGDSKSYQSLTRDYLWLQALGAWIPKVGHWNENGYLLTHLLYLECVSMAGQFQGLEGKLPKEFRSWNHNDLYGIFSRVFSEILVLLREVQIDNVTTLSWNSNLFATRRLLRTIVKDRSLFHDGQFILVVKSSIGASRLCDEFPKAAKLAGNSAIAELVRNALSGVPLRNLPYAPTELKSKHDAAYFEINTQSELWQSIIKKDEPIALHIDECIENVEIEFHVIR